MKTSSLVLALTLVSFVCLPGFSRTIWADGNPQPPPIFPPTLADGNPQPPPPILPPALADGNPQPPPIVPPVLADGNPQPPPPILPPVASEELRAAA